MVWAHAERLARPEGNFRAFGTRRPCASRVWSRYPASILSVGVAPKDAIVTVLEEAVNSNGDERARLAPPYDGWVSKRVLSSSLRGGKALWARAGGLAKLQAASSGGGGKPKGGAASVFLAAAAAAKAERPKDEADASAGGKENVADDGESAAKPAAT